jgi:hypothetical protein
MGLEPKRIPYLRDASRYLGNAAADRIIQRGDPPARFSCRFDVVKHLEWMRS